MLINYSIHNHVYRCLHAVGSERDMVLKAIDNEISFFGVSDHIPFKSQMTGFKMDISEKDEYIEILQDLKKEFKNQINVYIGFEAEYQKNFEEYLISLFRDDKIDYLILGQHFFDVLIENSYYPNFTKDKEYIKHYVDRCIEAMETNLFIALAHPDLIFSHVEFDDYAKEHAIRLIKAAISNDVYLEYNAGGVRRALQGDINRNDYLYPKLEFFALVKELNALVIVGSDAHAPSEIKDNGYYTACEQVIELGLNLVYELDFKSYTNRINLIINTRNN